MRHKNYFILLLLVLAALTASAQTCPGPANRTALINLQKSQEVNGTKWGQTVLTDTCGNQRYVTLDSVIVIVVDSIQADTTLQRNWYTHNGVTTDLLRTALVKRSAWWRGIDSVGFFRFSIRPDLVDGTQVTMYQDSLVFDADTVLWRSTWHPALQFHDLGAESTYFHADSLKVVGIGQFPDLQNIVFDGTYKGFYYYPDGDGVMIINGDGVNGYTSQIVSRQNDAYMQLNDVPGDIDARFQLDLGASFWSTHNSVNPTYSEIITNLINIEDVVVYTTRLVGLDTNRNIITYFGLSDNPFVGYTGRRAWGVRSYISDGEVPTEEFDWLQAYLPNDTTENAVSFYNRAYYWKNEHPTGVAGDTIFHYWAEDGVNAGKNPGFMTLDAICAHCSESAVNWYNSNGTTTNNTRIATVTETATWLSDDVVADGVYPFRFQLAGGGVNEPEMMVWDFPTDSVTLSQSDQELILFANNFFVFKSDQAISVQADSFSYNPNLGGVGFRVGANNVVTQNAISGASTHRDAIEYNTITGTAQTEIFLDGSSAVWVVPTNSNTNFKIHVAAICSAAGNGVGISTGDAWDSWHVGGIKRITNTTSLVGTVQTPATAQSDASMSTSVVTIDADDGDESLRIRFTPPSTAGSTTVIRVVATLEVTQTSY